MPSNKNIDQLKKLSKSFSKARAIYFTEYHGLNVGDITKLRGEFFKAQVEFTVAKNTLIKLAAKDNNINPSDDLLKGSTALAISYDEPVAPAKILKEFKKENELPDVKGIFFDGEFLPGTDFSRLAEMPSKEELLAKFGMILNSPIQKLIRTVGSPIHNVLGVLNNLKDKKNNTTTKE